MGWLRRFLHSEDPIVKIAFGLSEPEALSYRELLENNGVPAMSKSRSFLSVAYGASMLGQHDLYVRRSDAERARELLAPLVRESQLVEE